MKGEWRKLHNEELNLMILPPHPIFYIINSRRMRWAGERRGVYRVLVGKT